MPFGPYLSNPCIRILSLLSLSLSLSLSCPNQLEEGVSIAEISIAYGGAHYENPRAYRYILTGQITE